MKKLGIALAALVAILAIAGYVVYGQLGRIIKAGVETYGPPLTGTKVSLSSARVSVFSGEGALHGLHVGNPKGYSDADAFDLSDISLSVDPKSVTGSVVHVRSLLIDSPQLLAEFDAGGKSNLDAILDHLRGGGGSGGSPGKGGKEVRLIVDEFRFSGGKVHAVAPAYGLDKSLALPTLDLKNIGAGQGGVTPSQLAAFVMKPIVASAAQAATDEFLKAQRAKLGNEAKGKLLDKLFGK